MNVSSQRGSGRRRGRALATALAVVMMTGSGLVVLSDARAESGRRICAYSFKATPRNYPSDLMNISIGLDYKKDGACPALNTDKLVATGYVDWDQVMPNPVRKWTCEDWGTSHQTSLIVGMGSDPCPNLEDDKVYAFFWMDPTLDHAKSPSHELLGTISDFQ